MPIPNFNPVSRERITPTIAAQMLKHNEGNRRLRVDRIERYAREMLRGQWLDDGSSIGFDKNGRLMQGQHRLSGVVLAGQTNPKIEFWWVVARDLPTESYKVMDQGLARSGADALGFNVANGKNKAAITRLYLCWTMDGDPRNRRDMDVISRLDVAEYYSANTQAVNDATNVAAQLYEQFAGGNRSAWGAFALRGWDLYRGAADEFIEGVLSGAGLDAGSPILALRNFVSNNRRLPTAGHHLAVVIKAWNDWMTHKTRSVMVFRIDEDFPDMRKTKAHRRGV